MIAAGANPGDGTNASTDTAQSVAGLIGNLARLEDQQGDKVPSLAGLSVALAAQDGYERAARASLDSLTTEQALWKDMQAAQYREIELLAVALDSSESALRKAGNGRCALLPLGKILTDHGCAVAQPDVARALSAYNLSWASGRRASAIDDRKLAQLPRTGWLRVSQEAANARANVLKVSLTELSTFGAGGIKPETIAAFLQALGVAAVAVGVN